MELRLLGPVELWAGDARLALGTPKQRCVLAVLALEANRVVLVETLVDRIWDDAPPDGARGLLQTYVARLRRIVAEAGLADQVVLTFHAGGYRLTVEPDLVDLHRFRRFAADAASAEQLRQALDLWRGDPLSGLPGAWAERMRETLRDQRLTAERRLIDLRLREGAHDEVLTRLDELVAAHPLDEKLIEQRMLALHRSGRQAEALRCYREARSCLLAELGDEPGPHLRETHQRMLRRDPALLGETTEAARESALPVPRQLPAATPNFVGRDEELHQLAKPLDNLGGTMVVTVINGTAGIGKTVLAVHWAHRVADNFPDGQLYVNLRGFDRTGEPMRPAQAIRGVLHAFEIPPERIPADLEALAGLYRSVLAGRRVLVLLDNARDAEHVRPLLPGAPGCLVLITSRDRLTGLTAQHGARPLTLDVLAAEESAALLARHLGHDRVVAEPAATATLVEQCVRLPLALAVAAARAATTPGLSLSALAVELQDERTRLDALDAGDPGTSIRAVFSWSCRQLSAPAHRLFRLLGLHPGPDLSPAAAASLAGVPARRVRAELAELTRAHLVTEQSPGRFACHDLLRAYAAEEADAVESAAERADAKRRMFEHYLYSALAADRLLDPGRDPIEVPPCPPDVVRTEFADGTRALRWFDAEHAVLLAAIADVTPGFDVHIWRLAWAVVTFLDQGGYWHDWLGTQQAALSAARRLGDLSAQACSHRYRGLTHNRLGRYDEAHAELRDALRLYRELGDRVGEARANLTRAWVSGLCGRDQEALGHAQQALTLFRAAGHRGGEANSLNTMGWYHSQLGEHEQALELCELAIELHHELEDRDGAAETWDSLGYAHHHLGNYTEAVAHYRKADELRRELGDRYSRAEVLNHLGDTHRAAGDPTAAASVWEVALSILTDLNHPEAEQVRAKLADLAANHQ